MPELELRRGRRRVVFTHLDRVFWPESHLTKSRRGAIVRYPLVNDELALLWMVEYGAVDMHVWTARADRPDRPDFVLFDLDPSAGVGFADVVAAALLVRDALDVYGLQAVVRTTGGEGLHVLVPIACPYCYAQV